MAKVFLLYFHSLMILSNAFDLPIEFRFHSKLTYYIYQKQQVIKCDVKYNIHLLGSVETICLNGIIKSLKVYTWRFSN